VLCVVEMFHTNRIALIVVFLCVLNVLNLSTGMMTYNVACCIIFEVL
jgi:hypothetical protein